MHKNNSVVDDPVQGVFEELAEQLYQSKIKGLSLMKGVLKINPHVTLEEAQDFKEYWLNRELSTPTYPQLWQFKKWLYQQDNRIVKHHKECVYGICDGEGWIETYNRNKHGLNYDGQDYLFNRNCACSKGCGQDAHRKLMSNHEYTTAQKGVIEVNGGDPEMFKIKDVRGVR